MDAFGGEFQRAVLEGLCWKLMRARFRDHRENLSGHIGREHLCQSCRRVVRPSLCGRAGRVQTGDGGQD